MDCTTSLRSRPADRHDFRDTGAEKVVANIEYSPILTSLTTGTQMFFSIYSLRSFPVCVDSLGIRR